MRATPIMTDVVSIGNRAPILEIDWRIQSMTLIAPNRAYPFGPVLSIPKTHRPRQSWRRTYINSMSRRFRELRVRRLRWSRREMRDEFAHRLSNDGSAHSLRGNDDEKRPRVHLCCDDLVRLRVDGDLFGRRTADRLNDRVDGREHGRRHDAHDIESSPFPRPRCQDQSRSSDKQDRIETALRVDRGKERKSRLLQCF